MTRAVAPTGDICASMKAISDASDLQEAAAGLVSDLGNDDEASDPIEQVRTCLGIDDSVADVTIAASLAQIAARGDPRERWLAAFGSPLGKHLALRGDDLNAVLETLLILAPRLNA